MEILSQEIERRILNRALSRAVFLVSCVIALVCSFGGTSVHAQVQEWVARYNGPGWGHSHRDRWRGAMSMSQEAATEEPLDRTTPRWRTLISQVHQHEPLTQNDRRC
jgi:hypothetical protein